MKLFRSTKSTNNSNLTVKALGSRTLAAARCPTHGREYWRERTSGTRTCRLCVQDLFTIEEIFHQSLHAAFCWYSWLPSDNAISLGYKILCIVYMLESDSGHVNCWNRVVHEWVLCPERSQIILAQSTHIHLLRMLLSEGWDVNWFRRIDHPWLLSVNERFCLVDLCCK